MPPSLACVAFFMAEVKGTYKSPTAVVMRV